MFFSKEVTIPHNHHITLDLPRDFPEGVAKLFIVPKSDHTFSNKAKNLKEAFLNLSKAACFTEIKDPIAWQREIRKDRPLP